MRTSRLTRYGVPVLLCAGLVLALNQVPSLAGQTPPAGSAEAERFSDSHFHLTNYVQQGTDVRKYSR